VVTTPAHTDGRRQRGERTRREIALRAAEMASVRGLSDVSLHQLALDLGLSKSGVAAAFGSKQDLQLATVAAARGVFITRVVAPALAEPPGLPRLRRLIDCWLSYVEDRVFPGGCFMSAVMPEFEARPGPVRDALDEGRRAWLALLAEQVSHMQDSGILDDELPASAVAFEIHALLAAANLDRNLTDDTRALEQARAVLSVRVGL
jgi:AcrR family transcriptional regulator